MSVSKVLLFVFLIAVTGTTLALPPQAEADMLMVGIKNDMDADRCSEALPKFEKISKLNAKTPETFEFHWASCLAKTARWKVAKKHLDTYITQSGSKGKFYKEALDLYSKADDTKKQKQEFDKSFRFVKEFLINNLTLDGGLPNRDLEASKPDYDGIKVFLGRYKNGEAYFGIFADKYGMRDDRTPVRIECYQPIPLASIYVEERTLYIVDGIADCRAGRIDRQDKYRPPLVDSLMIKETKQADRNLFNESYQKIRVYIEENGFSD